MTTIDQISQVLSDHASNAIDEAEALRRVHDIACPTSRIPQMLCILVNHEKDEIENQRKLIRSRVASLMLDANSMVAEMEARGPDAVSTAWVSMRVSELAVATANLKASRERLRDLEDLFED